MVKSAELLRYDTLHMVIVKTLKDKSGIFIIVDCARDYTVLNGV